MSQISQDIINAHANVRVQAAYLEMATSHLANAKSALEVIMREKTHDTEFCKFLMIKHHEEMSSYKVCVANATSQDS